MKALWVGWLWLIAPPIGVDHYHHREGLAIQDAYGVVAGTDGMVWIHSDNGLIRFDGSRFRNDPSTARKDVVVAQAIGDSVIVSFTFDHAAFIHPVDRLSGSRQIAFPDSLRPRSFLHAVGIRGSKQVYGTTQSSLLVDDAGIWSSVDLPTRTNVPLRVPMVVPTDEGWIIGTTDGLWRWTDSGFESVDDRIRIVGKITQEGGRIWIPDRTHLYRWEDGLVERVLAFADIGIRNVVTQAAWSPSGDLWLSTLDEGLVIIRYHGDGERAIRRELTSMKVSGVARAPDGSMWVTTLGNGVYRFHPWFDAFGMIDAPTDDAVIFAEDLNGFGYVVAHANRGVFVKRNNRWERLISEPVTDVDPVEGGLVVSSGEMAWLLRADGGKTDLMEVFRRGSRILNPPVKSAEWVDGRLYLALPIGVYEVDLATERVVRLLDGRVSVARRALSGHWMVGRPDRIEIRSPDWSRLMGELPMGANDASMHADGRFRVASPQAGLGILEADPMRWIPMHTGSVERVWTLRDSIVVMVGPDGFYRMDDRPVRIPITPEGIAPGINWVWRDDAGTLHLSSRTGIITVDLDRLTAIKPVPVVRVADVYVDGADVSRLGPVRMGSGHRAVGITLAVDGASISPVMSIEYRVGTSAWSSLTGMTVLIDGVPAGETLVEFRVVSADGADTLAMEPVRILRTPAFWERASIRRIGAISLILLTGFTGIHWQKRVHRRRIEQFKEEDRMRHLERIALTQLLTSHFLFNTLSTIRSVAGRSVEEVQLYVSRLARVIRALIDRSYEPETDLATEIDWIRDYLTVEGTGRGLDIRLTTSGLPESEWDEVMLPSFVLQPVFENAMIHGRAQSGKLELRCEVRREDRVVRITVVNECEVGIRPRSAGAGLRLVTDRVRAWARYHGFRMDADEILTTWQDGGFWHVHLRLPDTVR